MARSRIRSIAIAATTLLALVGCSGDDGPSALLPSSAFPGETGALPTTVPPATGATGGTRPPTGTTGSAATGPTGVLTGPTLPATVGLAAGQAAVTTTGDVVASGAMTSLISSVYSAPPGGMALVWTAGGTNATTFGLGGLSFTGSQPTSPTLSLTLVVQTKAGIFTFGSTAGECVVTIGVATEDQIAGAFTCGGLVGAGGEVVDASGSFTAQG